MCGIVGVMGSPQASQEVHQALLMLQHRGQDSAGILSVDAHTGKFHLHKSLGQVSQVFDQRALSSLAGQSALGHTRYSTIGDVKEQDLQPMLTSMPIGIGLVHNGNVSNYRQKRDELIKKHRYFTSDNDLELMLHLLSESLSALGANELQDHSNREPKRDPKPDVLGALVSAVRNLMQEIEGGYSVIGLLGAQGLFAFRDPHGIRPLVLGEKNLSSEKKSYILASETCVLQFLGYQYVRDIQAGELIWINARGELISRMITEKQSLPCMFEWVYFSGADSTLESQNVYQVRLRLGQALARRIPPELDIDLVAPVPDTSRPAAIALAETLKKPFREVLIKNRYVQRSFITNGQDKRNLAVKLKFSVVDELVAGKNILLVDDSIVRGTTSRKIIELLKQHGAKQVYLASTCPPITHPCYYGIDFPSREELVAHQRDLNEIASHLQADRVIYSELDDLTQALDGLGFCRACLTGEYPYPLRSKT
jgi:amidophosphoribosyltransferase